MLERNEDRLRALLVAIDAPPPVATVPDVSAEDVEAVKGTEEAVESSV